jgi:hypothetical protein
VLAAAQTTLGRTAKREWDETLRDTTPNPGWTTRLGDIGRLLGISAVAVGKILELLGYRSEGSVTDSAVRAGCGVRRWNGFALFYDWRLDRVLSAIRAAVEDPGTSAIANALAASIAKQNARDRVAACKRNREETEAAGRREQEAMISGLEVELRALRATDPGMGLLTAVEYITSDPAARMSSSDVAMLRIGASGPEARGKTTWAFRRSLGPRPKTSPYLSAAQGLKVFRFRTLFRHTASQNGWICPSWEQPAMPGRGTSSFHHLSCAQVGRQHHQVGGSCRFYPVSHHSPSRTSSD